MQEIYIICALDVDGTETIMRDFYSTKEYAMQAIEVYKSNDANKVFYYTVGNLVK